MFCWFCFPSRNCVCVLEQERRTQDWSCAKLRHSGHFSRHSLNNSSPHFSLLLWNRKVCGLAVLRKSIQKYIKPNQKLAYSPCRRVPAHSRWWQIESLVARDINVWNWIGNWTFWQISELSFPAQAIFSVCAYSGPTWIFRRHQFVEAFVVAAAALDQKNCAPKSMWNLDMFLKLQSPAACEPLLKLQCVKKNNL